MEKFEYKVWEAPHAIPKRELNILGEDGWELVSVLIIPADVSYPRTHYAYFKRVIDGPKDGGNR